MTKITQSQSRLERDPAVAGLIEQIKSLKEIRPRKEWAVLLRSQILTGEQVKVVVSAQKVSIFDIISNFKFQISNYFSRRLAYSFAVVLLIIFGAFGFAEYTMPGDLLFPVKKIAENSQAALTGQSGLKQNVAVLNNRINDLAKATKEGRTGNIPSAVSEVNANASELTKTLNENPNNDPEALKEITASLKVLASVQGTDLTATPEVEGLYQAVARQQIEDLEKSTLTEEQQEILTEVKDLYNKGYYSIALEKIWDLSNKQPDLTEPTDLIDTTTEVNNSKINN